MEYIPEKIKRRSNLKRLMKERGLNAVKVAELYGCTPEHIYKYLSGHRNIGEVGIEKLSGVLKVDKKEFIKMPPEIGSPELDELWEQFYEIQKGEHGDLFLELLHMFNLVRTGQAPPELLKSIAIHFESLKTLFKKA